MKQMSLGLEAGHRGAELAARRAGPDWTSVALDAFRAHARRNLVFTTEDVRAASSVPNPPDKRAWGQVALLAKRIGMVKGDGWVRAASATVHGMVVTQWRSCIFEGAQETR